MRQAPPILAPEAVGCRIGRDRAEIQKATMNLRSFVAAAAILPILAASGHATDLRPIEAQPIQFGAVTGTAYYTEDRDGYRVVATLATAEATRPVRFEAVLAPGQSILLSAPGKPGMAAETLTIRAVSDQAASMS
jgi:hypothetical protein